MSDTRTFNFSASERLQIINLLPQQSGSLRESIQIKRLRDRLNFTDQERETIDMDRETGSLDPSKLSEVSDMEVDLGPNERDIIAGAFVQREDEGNVPTSDAFVELAVELQEEINEFREQLD